MASFPYLRSLSPASNSTYIQTLLSTIRYSYSQMIEYGRNPKQTFSAATPRRIDVLVVVICLIAFTSALFLRSGRLSSRSQQQQQQRKLAHTFTWWPSLLRFRLGQSQARGGSNDDEKIRDSGNSARADAAGIDSDANSKNGLRAGGFEKFGEWHPQPYTYPPIPAIDLPVEALEIPKYRPFKWGAYNITMGIRPMPPAEWIEVDSDFARYYRIRERRMEVRGEGVVRVLGERRVVVKSDHDSEEVTEEREVKVTVPSAELAAKELLYDLAEFLSRRYPRVYSVTRSAPSKSINTGSSFLNGWSHAGAIRTVTIHPVGVTFNLEEILESEGAAGAMRVAGLLVQDDLAIMMEGSDGRYYFQAGAICLPGFWRMEDKLGMPLEEIHVSGDVPMYKEKLETSMARFFGKLRVDKPVLRNNYFFQIVDEKKRDEVDAEELAWSDTTNGEEGAFDQVRKAPGSGASVERGPGLGLGLMGPKAATSVENVRFRTERQSLRRLRESGGIVFTIRTYVARITDIAGEDERGEMAGRMASAIESWPEEVARYKNRRLYGDVVVPYLEGRRDYP